MTSRLAAIFVALLLLPKVSMAQPSLRESLSVRPVRDLAFDAFVHSVSSKGSMAAVIAELSALTRDDKARPGEAVLLALLLNESGHEAESLTVLRENARRHPTDHMALAALARGCAENGFNEEQEAVLTQLYQLPAPPHQRLECLRQLAIVKQDHGRLREMRDAWVKQPKDAYGWMELAVLQKRAGEEAESRRCVYEASKLRPKDVLLLGEIARREAGYGFIKEALSTLDAADQVAKSSNTELLRCLIHLESDEESKALAMLAALSLPADADLELVRATADKLASSTAWSEMVRLLDQALATHATNYQLQYLRAVALEEKGEREAAATAFMAMLRLDAEIQADESVEFGRRYRTPVETRFSLEGLVLPAGSLGLMQSQDARQSAYSYKSNGSGLCIICGYTQVEDAPRGPFIALPESLTEAMHFAAAHLRRLLPGMAATRRAEAEKALVAGGLEDPEVLLETGKVLSPRVQARHPRDPALHAARLLSNSYWEKEALEVLDAEVELFRGEFPQLAFLAACRAYGAVLVEEARLPIPSEQPDSAAARRVAALPLADQIAGSPQVIEALLGLLPYRADPPPKDPAVEEPESTAEELRILTHAIDLALHLSEISRGTRTHTAISIIQSAMWRNDLPDALRLVREMVKEPMAWPAPAAGKPEAAPLPSYLDELGITHPMLIALATSPVGQKEARAFAEPRFAKMRAVLAQVPEAEVRRAFEHFMGDLSGVEAEVKQRLAKPQPTLADHLLANWLAIKKEDKVSALQHLVAASTLTKDAAQLRSIDEHVLGSIDRSTEKLSNPLRSFVIAAIERLQAVELHPAFTERSNAALIAIGTVADEERLQQRMEQKRQALMDEGKTERYSMITAYEQRQEREQERTGRLAAAFKARDLPAIAALGREWLAPHIMRAPLEFSTEQMQAQLGGEAAFKLLLRSCKPDPARGEAAQLGYADILTYAGDEAAALQIYLQMAERDADAFRPRLRAAFLLAEKAPDQALAQLRSIRVESALAEEYGGSPLAMLMRVRRSGAQRVAVARLLTSWINALPNPSAWHELLDASTCRELIQTIQEGGSSNDVNPVIGYRQSSNVLLPASLQDEKVDDSKFPSLDLAENDRNYFIPKGAGAAAMKQARAAHDDLCRALLRLPEAQPDALAALASLVIREGGDLSECARLAEALLRDPQAREPLQQWLSGADGGGEVFAGDSLIAVPSPVTILARHAAQRKDFTAFETTCLPLVETALGSSAAMNARLYAGLYRAPEADYPEAAAAWLATRPRDENRNVRSCDEVLNVWQWRGLHVGLHEVLISNKVMRAELEFGNMPETVTRYISVQIKAGREADAIAFYQALRDQLISSDAAERRRLIAAWQKQLDRYRSDSREVYRLSPRELKPSHVDSVVRLLKNVLRDPELICLLPLALEEGLLGRPEDLRAVASEMMKPKTLRSPEAGIALAEHLGFLAEAAGWHDYVLSDDSAPHTWMSILAGRFRDAQESTEAMRQMLAARRPQTLGSEVFAALLLPKWSGVIVAGRKTTEDKREELLRKVLTRRQAELAAIPLAQRRTFSLLLRTELMDYPDLSKFDAGLAVVLQPFLDAEADDLVPLMDRILAAKEWAEVGMNVSEFAWRFPATLAQVARRHPAKAEQVVRHACELLRKTPEGERERLRGADGAPPIARFLWYLGQVPQLLGTCMSLAEEEKLSLDPEWMQNVTNKLTDYQLIHHRDHLAAIFTQSPFVADAAHFQDWVMPPSGRKVAKSAAMGADPFGAPAETVGPAEGEEPGRMTLLDRVVNALNWDDANAQWLHQRLKAAPEQTFGVQLTLALLESAAPIRKAKGYENTVTHDPAPLTAFAAAHAKDIAQLKPATGKVVQTLLDHYLKPSTEKPVPKQGDKPGPSKVSNEDPFGAAPPAR